MGAHSGATAAKKPVLNDEKNRPRPPGGPAGSAKVTAAPASHAARIDPAHRPSSDHRLTLPLLPSPLQVAAKAADAVAAGRARDSPGQSSSYTVQTTTHHYADDGSVAISSGRGGGRGTMRGRGGPVSAPAGRGRGGTSHGASVASGRGRGGGRGSNSGSLRQHDVELQMLRQPSKSCICRAPTENILLSSSGMAPPDDDLPPPPVYRA